MRFVTFKDGCRFKKWTPFYSYVFNTLHEMMNKDVTLPDLVITSVDDSTHATNSKHYKGGAVDVRSHNFKSKQQKIMFALNLKSKLGPDFTVIFENEDTANEHFHVQVRKDLGSGIWY